MTPNEITTVLASGMNKTFDVPFRTMLMERVDLWRARHIKNSLDKTPADRKFFKSTIFLSTTQTPEVPCDLPVTVCDVWVTGKIPQPLRANSMLFDYVGAVNGMNPFLESHPGTVQYKNSGRYSKGVVPFIYTNEKLYIYKKVPMIRVDFIASTPTDLQNYQCVSDASKVCNFWDTEYPCTPEILQLIFQSIREVDFRQDPTLLEQSIPVNPVNDLSN